MSGMLKVGIKAFLFPPISVSNFQEVITYAQTAPDLDPAMLETDDIQFTFSSYILSNLNLAAKAIRREIEENGCGEETKHYLSAFKHSLKLTNKFGDNTEEAVRDQIVDMLVKRAGSTDTKINKIRQQLKLEREQKSKKLS